MKKNGLIIMMLLASLNLLGQRNTDLLLQDKQVAKMKTELSLTDNQVTQLQQLNERFLEERRLMQADTALSRHKVVAEKTRLLKERNAGIKKILTNNQFTRWMEIRKEQSGRAGGGRVASKDNLQELKTTLDLTDEQVKKIMAINANMSREFKKLRSDTVILRQNRSGELKKIIADRNAKIKKVLTEEQYVKFLEYEAERNVNRRRGPRVPAKK